MTETAQEEGSRTWELGEADAERSVSKLTEINERACRQGLRGRYTWTLGEPQQRPVYLDTDWPRHDPETGERIPDYYVWVRQLSVSGVAPKLGGWQFIATLSWEGGVLVTRTAPDFTGRIDEDVIRAGWCDHCKTDRRRIDTYLLEGSSGQRRQVGSSCIRDFLGHDFRPSWMRWGGELDDMEESFSYRWTPEATTTEVLAYAASMTEAHGWVSRDKAEIECREPSSSLLRALLFGNGGKAVQARRDLAPTKDHYAKAAEVREWAASLDPGGSEYLANIQRLAAVEFITERNAGLLGSAVAAHNRELARNAEREASQTSEFIGKPKERITVQAVLRSDTPVEGDYGTRHRYGFKTAEGNSVVWWASSGQGLRPGDEITLTGTVKEHETYHDVKSTILTRCRFAQAEPELEAS